MYCVWVNENTFSSFSFGFFLIWFVECILKLKMKNIRFLLFGCFWSNRNCCYWIYHSIHMLRVLFYQYYVHESQMYVWVSEFMKRYCRSEFSLLSIHLRDARKTKSQQNFYAISFAFAWWLEFFWFDQLSGTSKNKSQFFVFRQQNFKHWMHFLVVFERNCSIDLFEFLKFEPLSKCVLQVMLTDIETDRYRRICHF